MDHVELHGALRKKAAIVDGPVPLAAAVRLNLKIPQKHPAHVGSPAFLQSTQIALACCHQK